MLWKKQPVGSKIADLTSKFKATDLGSFASESALATGLSTKIGTMTNGEVAFIQFQMSSATTNFGAFAYVGTLTRVAATYASFSVSVATSGTTSHTVVGSMNNGTWKMEQVSLNSNTTLYNLGEGTKGEMESALVTAGNNMKVNVQGVRFGITSASSPFQSTTYLGKLMRYSSGRYVVQANGITLPDQDIIGVYRSSTWYWTSINSKIAASEVSSFLSIDSTKIALNASSNCYKTGNTVLVSLDLTVQNGVSGTVYIGTVVESIRPRKSVYGTLCDYSNKTTISSFAIQPDGRVIVYNLISGHEFLGSVCYVV